MSSEFKKGDQVEWNSRNGPIEGEVVKKLTHPTNIKSHHVNASKENPQFLVKSDKTGNEAAHKAEALTRLSDDS